MAKRRKVPSKTNSATAAKAGKAPRATDGSNGRPPKESAAPAGAASSDTSSKKPIRLLPKSGELKSLYQKYTAGARFDEHDKAFYFVLDVGGLSRARQLIDHVEEVLAELEEFGG